ncbi:MAG TPA: DEAD/DEAH box helicase [Luteibaculaceae bacterium]|nr:DEAD/DEAH box helicase [Luteibaculaceae bacterium]
MPNFEELGLRPEVLDAVSDLGFVNPSEIQSKAVPLLIGGSRDFVGLAQTGTGKTAAFGLPLASLVDFSTRAIQALVICPTRELCLQITDDLNKFTKYYPSKRITAVYGGASVEMQLKELKKGPQIVVATPGRLKDFLDRKALDFSLVRYAVLDEADEMLNMGFKEDLDDILEYTPTEKNTWLFSATMPKEVAMIAKNYMVDPIEVTVGGKNSSAKTIKHQYFMVHDNHKYMALKRILDFHPDIYGIIFCQTRTQTRDIADALVRDGYDADALHGDLSQAQRDSVMRRFRERNLQILVATDVAARGIDVDDVTHVIQYSIPDEVENYTHRSGRTGRAGKDGVSMALVSPRDTRKLPILEKILGTKIELVKVPSGQEVCMQQLMNLVDRVKKTEVREAEIGPYLNEVFESFAGLSKEELITKFISAEFNRFLHYYKSASDLNLSPNKQKTNTKEPREKAYGEFDDDKYQKIFINIGELDGLDKGFMLRFICDSTRVNSKAIGRIDIRREFSFVSIEKNEVNKVMDGLKGVDFEGREVRTEFTKDKGGSSDRGGRRPKGDRFSGTPKSSPRFDKGGTKKGSSFGGGSGQPKDGGRKKQFASSRTSWK